MPLRFGSKNRYVAVSARFDALLLLGALRTKLGRLALTLGLHAQEHLLRNLLGQIGATNAHVDDLSAQLQGFSIHLIANPQHQIGAVLAHKLHHRRFAQHAANSRIQHGAKLVVAALNGANRLIEAQRIDDFVTQERVHLDAAVIGGEHFLLRRLKIKNAVIEINHVLDKWRLEVQARRGDERALADRLAEPEHERLFGLMNDEHRSAADDDDCSQHDKGCKAYD